MILKLKEVSIIMKSRSMVIVYLLLAALIFTACGQSEKATPGDEPSAAASVTVIAVAEAAQTSLPLEEPTEEPTVATTEEPTIAPTEVPTVVPTEAPTAVPTEEPTESCLTCHSDKEQLMSTAAPEPEETESSESSGVG